MAAWLKYLSIFILTALFSISFLTFIYQVQINNNAPQTIYDSNSPLNSFNSNNSLLLSSFQQKATQQYNASASEITTAPTGAFILFSILTSLGRFAILPITFTNNLFTAISASLGIPSYILNTILAIIILAGVFFWYRSVKVGD